MNVLPCVIIFGQQDKTDGNSAVPSQGRHQSELAGGGLSRAAGFPGLGGGGLTCIFSAEGRGKKCVCTCTVRVRLLYKSVNCTQFTVHLDRGIFRDPRRKSQMSSS